MVPPLHAASGLRGSFGKSASSFSHSLLWACMARAVGFNVLAVTFYLELSTTAHKQDPDKLVPRTGILKVIPSNHRHLWVLRALLGLWQGEWEPYGLCFHHVYILKEEAVNSPRTRSRNVYFPLT